MHILDYYRDTQKQADLKQLLTLAAQKHPSGLPEDFLEKDLWVTEILRLLYDEQLLGEHAVAFKGGTALSKCWKAIHRFSEDIDLSIHWADLAGVDDEAEAWAKTTSSRSQRDKFRKRQQALLEEWSTAFTERLNTRLNAYEISSLNAEIEADSHGEKIQVSYPRLAESSGDYQLDYVLLEFGGRNRGQPTVSHQVSCYMAEVPETDSLDFPNANVQVFDPAYILWEKLTALHQFSTMEREPDAHRLARHWYDADCLIRQEIADPLNTPEAMTAVIEMKEQRWSEKGVVYKGILNGQLQLIPAAERLARITKDHQQAIDRRLFYYSPAPDSFDQIIERLTQLQEAINSNKGAS